jgi:hypothetical protein
MHRESWTRRRKEGRAPTFIFINQIRSRGVPGETTTPGGFAPKHAAALRLRLSGKDVFDRTERLRLCGCGMNWRLDVGPTTLAPEILPRANQVA